jgi:hypothetical protein
MSQLQNALRQIAKKSSHPNALLYQFQRANAKQKHLVKRTEDEPVLLAQPDLSELKDADSATSKAQIIGDDIAGLLAPDMPSESSHSMQIAACESASPETAQEPSRGAVEPGDGVPRDSDGEFEKEQKS